MKKVLLILILNISLLFSPSPKPGTTDPNGRYVKINRFAGFFLNPDTYGFIFPSIRPSQLLLPQAQRQSRPLFILTGSAVGYSVTFLTWPFHKNMVGYYERFWRGSYPKEMILLTGNFYLGYLLLNILVLWISLYLFEKIFKGLIKKSQRSDLAMFLLMIFIASNPVTKAFFWTVHQQMFAFLSPLLCIYLLLRFEWLNAPVSFFRMAGIFLSGGLLLLVYGNFLLLLPCLVFCLVSQESKFNHSKNRLVFLLGTCALILVFFLPTICWIGILKINGVVYFSSEITEFHQIVWIAETLKQSVKLFFSRLGTNTIRFFQTTREILILLIFSIIILFAGKIRIPVTSTLVNKILFVLFSFLLFFWLLGFYESRLTNTLIPVIVCFWVATLGPKITSMKMILILSSLVLVWHGYVLLSYGPFY